MTNETILKQPVDKKALASRMMIGGTLNLILICLFIFSGPPGRPEWGSFWVVRPILVVTFAGLMGGLVFYVLTYYLRPAGWKKVLAFICSGIIYIVGSWMGMVLGFVGTWWN